MLWVYGHYIFCFIPARGPSFKTSDSDVLKDGPQAPLYFNRRYCNPAETIALPRHHQDLLNQGTIKTYQSACYSGLH